MAHTTKYGIAQIRARIRVLESRLCVVPFRVSRVYDADQADLKGGYAQPRLQYKNPATDLRSAVLSPSWAWLDTLIGPSAYTTPSLAQFDKASGGMYNISQD